MLRVNVNYHHRLTGFSNGKKEFVDMGKDGEKRIYENISLLNDQIEQLKYERSGANGTSSSINLKIRVIEKKIEKIHNDFFEHNVGLIYFSRNQFLKWGLELDAEELESDLSFITLDCSRKFDHNENVRFNTYCGRGMNNGFSKLLDTRRRRWSRYSHFGTMGDNEDGNSVYESIPNPNAQDPAKEWETRQNAVYLEQMLGKAFKRLNEQEQYVIKMHYGMNEYGKCFLLREIGIHMGVSDSRAQEISRKALKKLLDMPEIRKLGSEFELVS